MNDADVVIIGGGIVGLATAMAISDRWPGKRVIVLDKEVEVARHQTGHNSGVIHSGIYYPPHSLKARYCLEGRQMLLRFCRDHGVRYEVCGKLIVASAAGELDALESLRQRGIQHGLDVQRLDPAAVHEREPEVSCLGALLIPATGVVDFTEVAATLARIVRERSVEIRLGQEALAIDERSDGVTVETEASTLHAELLVNCAGLQSDRIARLAGHEPSVQIIPFRGEYYELVSTRRGLVRHLVYPVPNPAFPFLGVHFTRMIDGHVHVGPNAVPGLAREGYRKQDVSPRDVLELIGYRGFWRLARCHAHEGLKEIIRSWSKAAFVRGLQRIIPAVSAADITPAGAGVRAQALRPNGTLVDDFLFIDTPRAVHVLNAPSPAATSSLMIGDAVAAHVGRILDLAGNAQCR